ncbi:MAG: phytoene/squalene synthase family protein [Pirellulales bacterium]
MFDDSAESYDHCRRLARRAGSNFYYSFVLLPPAKRRAMHALYAFLRRTDDLVDSAATPDEGRRALDAWRLSLDAALNGDFDDPLLPALADTVSRYQIPPAYLTAVLDGVAMDLAPRRYETFADLEQYCDRVAGAVAMSCLHIFGFHGRGALEPARRCGLAMQLTNILRDLSEDVVQGRVYLPLEDLRRFGYTAEDLAERVDDERFRALLDFEVARARKLFADARTLGPWLEVDARRAMGAMLATYGGLLDKIAKLGGEVLHRRVRIGRWRRLRILARWLLLPTRPAAVG